MGWLKYTEFMDISVSKHIHNRIFDVTLALYRVTDFFPKDEPLRFKLRDEANRVFQSMIEYEYRMTHSFDPEVVIVRLSLFKSMLQLARSLQFVKSANLMVLEREYDALLSFFTQEARAWEGRRENAFVPESFAETQSGEVAKNRELPSADVIPDKLANKKKLPIPESALGERQKKIIEFIRRAGHARANDTHALFPHVSAKTIQRILQDLVESDFLKKEGDKRWTFYSIKDV